MTLLIIYKIRYKKKSKDELLIWIIQGEKVEDIFRRLVDLANSIPNDLSDSSNSSAVSLKIKMSPCLDIMNRLLTLQCERIKSHLTSESTNTKTEGNSNRTLSSKLKTD